MAVDLARAAEIEAACSDADIGLENCFSIRAITLKATVIKRMEDSAE